jgi:hypothetical protein
MDSVMADSTVAHCAALGAQPRNSDGRKRNESATPDATGTSDSPMTGRQLRAQLRAQLNRNRELRQPQLKSAESCAQCCAGATATEHVLHDPNTERRRAKALAVLAENPGWRRFVLVEAGEPTIIGVAISGIGYGELELPARRYDAQTLLELIDVYGSVEAAT